MNVVVAGMLAGDPHQGGATWAVVQYALGLRQLGHEVTVIDPLPAGPITTPMMAYFDRVRSGFNLRAAIVPADGAPYGLNPPAIRAAVRRADLLINLSGRWRDPELFGTVPVRVYVDLDPAFTQLWHHQGADVGLADHTHHVTVGTSLPVANHLPLAGVSWTTILPPVVLDAWPVVPAPDELRMTTVANWRSYGSIEHDGVHYGQKAHSFRQLDSLPNLSPVPLTVALSIHEGDGDDRDKLTAAGWELLDAADVVGDPARYQRFVHRSWAELGVAKSGYVAGRTGWISDRTACYLASGRPAAVQDTGIDGALSLGEGMLTFGTVDEAADAIERVRADYPRHAAAARRLAEQHFDSRRVLGSLLAEVTS